MPTTGGEPHLGRGLVKRVGVMDLVELKDVSVGSRCPWSEVALFAGLKIKGLLADGSNAIELGDIAKPATIEQVLTVYLLIEYPSTPLIFSGNEQELISYLQSKLAATTLQNWCWPMRPTRAGRWRAVGSLDCGPERARQHGVHPDRLRL